METIFTEEFDKIKRLPLKLLDEYDVYVEEGEDQDLSYTIDFREDDVLNEYRNELNKSKLIVSQLEPKGEVLTFSIALDAAINEIDSIVNPVAEISLLQSIRNIVSEITL